MELESLEGGQVGLIVHLVRVRTERSFHPFLEERFFFEVAQLARRFPFFSGTLGDSIVGRERRIHPPKHHPLIGTMRILETAAHFHFYFMDERVGATNLLLHFARFAEKRTEFSRPPADKRGLVLALKVMPLPARALHPCLCFRTLRNRCLPQ